MNTVHSELGASGYKRWKVCPGSVRLSRGIERKSSAHADEGTRAHELGESILKKQAGWELVEASDEMVQAVMVYVGHVEILRRERPAFENIEAKLDLVQYHPKLFGTGDYVCYFSETKTLHVVDYKHGAGVAVEVEEPKGVGNSQLLYYAAAALHKANVPVKKIVATIVQPRCPHPDGPVRSFETTPVDLLDFLAQLVEDAKRTEAPDAPLVPSSECRWCAAKGICPALNERAMETAQQVFSPIADYDPVKLGEALNRVEQVKAWIEGIHEFAYREAEAGREIPGWKLVEKRATRKWREDLSAEEIAHKMGVEFDRLFDMKLLSPAQFEKQVPKEQREAFNALLVKESSGKKLVPVTDDREPTLPKIKTVFEAIPEGDL